MTKTALLVAAAALLLSSAANADTVNGEIAQLETAIDGMPGVILSYELAFLCEV